MKVYVVVYGEIDSPDLYYGAYSSKEKAKSRLEDIARFIDYNPDNDYTSLAIEEFELDKDILP